MRKILVLIVLLILNILFSFNEIYLQDTPDGDTIKVGSVVECKKNGAIGTVESITPFIKSVLVNMNNDDSNEVDLPPI